MTEIEKQREREAKAAAAKILTEDHVRGACLDRIDKRMAEYCLNVATRPDEHNVYELLAVVKFLRMYTDSQYRFDLASVKAFFALYEFLKFDGTSGRRSYELTPVQIFQFSGVLGFWRDETHRLVRNALFFVPRKYGKTTEVCAFAINDFLFGDDNAQAYTAANSYDQSKICFDAIRKSLRDLDPGGEYFKSTRELIRWRNDERQSFVRCLSNNPEKLDGLNASTVILDEYAQADSADLKNVLTTSMGVRENPLVVTITTASDKTEAPFYEELKHEKSVLLGEIFDDSPRDDTSFSHLFLPDCDDAEGDPKTWAKVHPHIGITVQPEYYEMQWAEAQKSVDNMKAFRTKMLNVFASPTYAEWINGTQIRESFLSLDIDKMGYHPDCVIGVDLSVNDDLSAVSYYIYRPDLKQSHIHTEYYLPRGIIGTHRNRDLYQRMADEGYLHLCNGDIIDYAQVVNDIMAHAKNLRILKIAYDPNRAAEFVSILKTMGAEPYLYSYKQTYYYFTKPCQAMKRFLAKKFITIGDNPMTSWCYDNCILDVDRMENCKPLKRTETGKIDGVISSLMALGVSLELKR